jgi:hypothetical protein
MRIVTKTIIKTTTVRTFLWIILLAMVCRAEAQQQGGGDAEAWANKLTNWMKTTLTLSEEQLPPVEEINLKYANKLYALKRNTIPRRQKLEVLKDNNAAKDEELKKVFTPDQFKLYQSKKQEIIKQMKQKIKEKKKGAYT